MADIFSDAKDESMDTDTAEPNAANIIDDLSRQLQNEKVANSLSLVDITFTCKVCNRKEKSLEDLVDHMKDGKCTTVKKARGRKKKSFQNLIKTNLLSPKEPSVVPVQVKTFGNNVHASERITRVKSGAMKRKSVMEMFDIKQEPGSDEEGITLEDLKGDDSCQTKKKSKMLKMNSNALQLVTINKTQNTGLTGVKKVLISGTDVLKANAEAKLYGREVRIPIGSLKEGEPKIIALNRAKEDSKESFKGSLIQIKEVDKKPVVEVLEEEKEKELKGNTTIYLKMEPQEEGKDENLGGEINVGLVEQTQNSNQIQETRADDGQNIALSEMQFAKVGPLLLAANKSENGNTEQDSVSELSNRKLDFPSVKRRKYNRLPSAIDYNETEIQLDGGYKCRRCVQRCFFSQLELGIHFKLHKPSPQVGYQCDKCDYSCDIWGRMMYHIIKHPDYLKQLQGTPMMKNVCGTFVCPICKKVFDKKSNLSNHYNKVHVTEHKICPICGQSFDDLNDIRFERHLDKCKGDELHCDFCPYKTTVRSNMRVHLRVHSGEGFNCDICGKAFPTKQRWQVHLLKHTNNRQRYPCEICGSDFCSMDAVKKHIQRMHTEKTLVYRCTMCPYTSNQETDFKKHVKCVHEKRYLCPVDTCDYRTNKEENLEAHKEYHNPDRIYRCNYAHCYHAYSSQKNLEGHMQGIHKVGSKHQCPICMKFFKRKTVLLRHLVSHTSERPYNCQECGATFSCHSTYYRHRAKTGHDAKREGVASVPQNITIQYVDTPDEIIQPSVSTVSVDFDSMAAMAQQVLQQESGQDPNLLPSSLDPGNEVITLEASQFAQLQNEAAEGDENVIGNVTYYVYNTDEISADDTNQMTEEQSKEIFSEEEHEFIKTKEQTNTFVQMHRNENDDNVGEQLINLDLPTGPALVKMDSDGAFTVINSHSDNGAKTQNKQQTARNTEEYAQSSMEPSEEVTDEKINENETMAEEVIYHEVDLQEFVNKNEVLNVIATGEEGEQYFVVQGESDAAISMLQLQGGLKTEQDEEIEMHVSEKQLEGSFLHLQDGQSTAPSNVIIMSSASDGDLLQVPTKNGEILL